MPLKIIKTKIKKLTPKQRKKIKKIQGLIRLIFFSEFMNNIRFWKEPYIDCYLLYKEKELIGFCYVDNNYISRFAIDEHVQKNYYGSFLINYVLKELKKKGHNTIYLYANKKAKVFWRKKGFENHFLGYYKKRIK